MVNSQNTKSLIYISFLSNFLRKPSFNDQDSFLAILSEERGKTTTLIFGREASVRVLDTHVYLEYQLSLSLNSD